MSNIRLLVFAIWGCLSGYSTLSQNADTPSSSRTLLDVLIHQHDSIPTIRLDTDWSELIQHKMEEEYQDGAMYFKNIDGSEVQFDIKLRARGNIRKQVCIYPPIKIKIPKEALRQLGLRDSFNHLKLILSCRDGKQQNDYLLKEALAYRLYEIVSPIYFKTKLIKLEGWDGKKNKFLFYAMLIEDEEEFAARIQGREATGEMIKVHTLDRENYLKMTFFQYMIANADWAIHNKHNVGLYYVPGYRKIVAIAYDFDYSGFIGANYAVPHESLPITSVTQRYFMGQFVTEEEALATADFFLSKKSEILRVCNNFELLDKKNRCEIEKFLVPFFRTISSNKKIKHEFVNEK